MRHHLRRAASASRSSAWRVLALVALSLATPAAARLLAQPASSDGRVKAEFGRLQDAIVLPDGRGVFLDHLDRRLTLVGTDGTVLSQAGRLGSGPGEFREPQAVILLAANLLGVVDPANSRLVQFRVESRGLTYVDEMRLSSLADGGCVLGDEIIVPEASERTKTRLTAYSASGGETRRFAPILPALSPGITNRLAYSVVGCDDARGRLYVAQQDGPAVEAYDAAGKLLWTARLTGFSSMIMEALEGTTTRYTVPPDGAHRIVSIMPLGGDSLLISAERHYRRNDSRRDGAVGTIFRLRASDGLFLGSEQVNSVLRDVGAGYAVWTREDPVPEGRILRLGVWP